MKKIMLMTIAGVSAATFFTACNGRLNTAKVSATDTTGLAAYKEWKTGNEAKNNKRKNNNYNSSGSFSSTTNNNAQVDQKKGWSKAAKYGVGGAVGGAVLGAVVHKKDPVRGAVVGGVILGSGGYIYGRSQDRKDGRIK